MLKKNHNLIGQLKQSIIIIENGKSDFFHIDLAH